MKKILIAIFILVSFNAFSQGGNYPLFQNDSTNIKGHSITIDNNGSVIRQDTTNRSIFNVPIIFKAYTTGAFPSIANAGAFNLDSLVAGAAHQVFWYSDASSVWHPLPTGGGGGGSGTVLNFSAGNLSPLFTTSVATSTTTPALSFTLSNAAANSILGNNTGSSAAPTYFVPTSTTLNGWFGGTIQGALTLTTTGTTGAATLVGTTLNIPQYTSVNAILQGGNAFAATMTLGTTDNNPINWIVNNAIKMTMFADGHFLIGTSGSDPAQTFRVDGTMALGGTITSTAATGFSMSSGNLLSFLMANNAAANIGLSLGMNNNWNNAGTSKNFINLNSAVQFTSGTGETITGTHDVTVVNNTGGTGHIYQAFVFEPVLTSTTGTNLVAFKNTAGDNSFNTSSGGTFFFKLVTFAAPTTSLASFNLTPSSAVDPTSPNNGDMWFNGTNLNFRHAGITSDLLTGGSTPTLQSVLTAGATLTGNNTITNTGHTLTHTGGVDDFTGATINVATQLQGNNTTNAASTAYADAHLPAVKASANSLLNTGTNSSVTTFTPSADGLFRISAYMNVTALTGGAVVFMQVSWKDETNTSQTYSFFPQGTTSANVSTAIYTPFNGVLISAKSGNAITVSTNWNSTGSINYDAGASIELIK